MKTRKMKYSILYRILPVLAIPVLLGSCVRQLEESELTATVQSAAGRRVTIGVGLPAQTKVTHELVGSSIHPIWEDGDQVQVVFSLDGKEVSETFTLFSGAGSQQASFYKEDSQLSDNQPFSVHYPVTQSGWAMQDGTLEHLPESLSASMADTSEEAQLKPALTYLHVVCDKLTGKFSSAYLNKLEGDFTMYSAPGVPGAVTVSPSGGFPDGKVDFYVAVMLSGATTATKLQVAFGNGVQGVTVDGQAFDPAGENCKFSWRPSKDYAPGNVYKVENKPLVSVTAAQAMPR